jgi:ELWxxDGT repeat protein
MTRGSWRFQQSSSRAKFARGASSPLGRHVLAFELLERRLLLTVSSYVLAEPLDLNGSAPGSGFTTTFLTGNGPVSIVDSATAAITYGASDTLSSLTVSLSNPQSDDVLSANTAGTSIAANYSGGTLILEGADSPANYQQVLRTIKFDNPQGGPYVPSETATFTLYDAQGALSNSAVATISMRTIRRAKDIVPGTASSTPQNFVDVDGAALFTANDGSRGVELWKSDGTGTGTVLVKDIRLGSASSGAQYLTNVNGTLFFGANDGSNGEELWKSDGTSSGTVLVKDIQPGPASQFGPVQLTNVSGTLFFLGNDGSTGYELWKSDGTTAGTVLVKELAPGPAGPRAIDLTSVGGILFFVVNGGSGDELWKSDGTSEGTVLVKAFPEVALSYPRYLTNVGGTLFFRATDGGSNQELWKSDGTTEGTAAVKEIRAGASGSYPLFLTNVGGTLFFVANDGTTGHELWKSDGTSEGTVLVKDITPGNIYAIPRYLTSVGSTLFFSANDATTGFEVWKSDGTSEGTVLVKDIWPGASNSIPRFLTNVAGTLFFQAGTSGTASELWKSDGTIAGTMLARDIYPGTSSSFPRYLANVGGALFFTANEQANGSELWVAGFPGHSSIAKTMLFYKSSSKWYVNSGLTLSDDNAIAPDKTAYLPGSGTSSFSAVSSYDKGVNGIMLDISGPHGAITVSDFQFKRGNNNTPGGWAAATAPTAVTTRVGAGNDASDRIELLWDDNQSVKKQWLEVIVEGNDTLGGFNTNTGLATSYVFYFGSAVSDSGVGNSGGFQVTATDEINARNNPKTLTATRSDINDFNRDGSVNSSDQIIARNNTTNLGNQLKFLVVGAEGPFTPEPSQGSGGAAIRSDANGTDGGGASAVAAALALGAAPSPCLQTSSIAYPTADDQKADRIAEFFSHAVRDKDGPSRKPDGCDDPAALLDFDDILLDVLAAESILK